MKNRTTVNREIESLLDRKSNGFTADELALLNQYTGYGGIKGTDIADARILYEYYTPDAIVRKMWALANAYKQSEIKKVLEPACGIGRFFTYAPKDAHLVGYDISKYACGVARATFPSSATRKVDIHHNSFESFFFEGNRSIAAKKVKELQQSAEGFDLVIGNPPYGKFEGKFAGMGEKTETRAESWDEYFISRGLDVLKPGGLLTLIIGATLQNGGTLFLNRPQSKVKELISHKGTLIDAYRLPEGSFDATDVSTEIVVFRKNA